ncbi:MAG: hypothetical protein II136_05720 [Prevotella sp.]|nr:hypothetical protein [Prevotella sp.]
MAITEHHNKHHEQPAKPPLRSFQKSVSGQSRNCFALKTHGISPQFVRPRWQNSPFGQCSDTDEQTFPLLKQPFARLCFSTKYIYKDISNDRNSSTLASTSLMVNIQLIGLHCSIYGLRSSLLAFKTKWRKKGQKTKAQGSTLGICSMLSFRPVGAKAFHSQNLLPVPGAFSATLQSQGVALG